jgi:hypothetical protein
LKPYVRQGTDRAGDTDERQKVFISRVVAFHGGTWSCFFDRAEELVERVVQDVRKWRGDSWRRDQATQPERVRWMDAAVLVSFVITALLTCAGMIAGALLEVPRETLVTAAVPCFGVMGLLFWLLIKKPI